MKENSISVKELAERAGIPPAHLRRILRAKFPRTDKGKAYEWKPGDPQIELILKAAKNGHKPVQHYKAEPQTGDKAQPGKPKATKKTTKAVVKPCILLKPVPYIASS
jgi:hypothetical protein